MFERRHILLGAAAALTMPRIAFAKAETERRLIFLIQRGAADGLATLAPTGDPAYGSLRGDLAADLMDRPKLGGLFALHPALTQIGTMYGKGEALFTLTQARASGRYLVAGSGFGQSFGWGLDPERQSAS